MTIYARHLKLPQLPGKGRCSARTRRARREFNLVYLIVCAPLRLPAASPLLFMSFTACYRVASWFCDEGARRGCIPQLPSPAQLLASCPASTVFHMVVGHAHGLTRAPRLQHTALIEWLALHLCRVRSTEPW